MLQGHEPQRWPLAVAQAQATPWPWVEVQDTQIYMALAETQPSDTNLILGP